MQRLTLLETNYQAAKLRLEAAQQEKLEAAANFLSVRAALRQTLETIWPARCGEAQSEKDTSTKKDGSVNWV